MYQLAVKPELVMVFLLEFWVVLGFFSSLMWVITGNPTGVPKES